MLGKMPEIDRLKIMARSATKGSANSSGFTLLELLVSITVLSLIITISYSALRLGTRSWDASIKIINNNTNTRSAVELMKNKLEHIYPIYWNNDAKRILSFAGDEESFKFIAPSPQGRELGEYFEYMFVINRNLSNASLELFYEPHNPEDNSFAVDRYSPSREILNNLSDIKFLYYGQPDNNRFEDWFAEWPDDFASFPLAVQVIITGQENMDLDINMVIKIQSELFQI